ncbi:MAG: hypothetical protein ABI151_14855 [Chitinophagaceae bacterium]
MNEASPFIDPLEDSARPTKLPGSINTLTILTFIGVGLGLLGGLSNYFMAESNYKRTEEMATNESTPSFMKSFSSPEALEAVRRMMENKLPILIITLVSLGLCLYGALQMRKLIKQGYYIWLMGELLPFIGAAIFLGISGFTGFALIGPVIAVLFIILYGTQLKYMK